MEKLDKTAEAYPLTPVQLGMLLHSLESKGSGIYVQQLVVTLMEPLHIEAWHNPWQKLVECHEVLRIRLDLEDLENSFQQVLSHASGLFVEHDWRSLALETLKTAWCHPLSAGGGEAHSTDHVRRALEALPETSIMHVYGPTKATTFATFYTIPGKKMERLHRIPIGKPIGNTTVFLMDTLGRLVPPGVSGEILIGGSGIADGYLNQPELTAKRFVPDPFSASPGARLFRSGDLGYYLPDGNIEFIGRLDDQIKVRGYRIEPGEIGIAIRRHPHVRQSVVISREDPQRGGRRLIAYIVPDIPERKITSNALQHFLRDKLPAYMIPSNFVFLSELPLSINGKIDRDRLPDYEFVCDPERQLKKVRPKTELQRQVLTIISDLLQRDDVGITDDFFQLGVNSITVMRAVARLQKNIGKDLQISDFFKLGTVARVAEKLGSLVDLH